MKKKGYCHRFIRTFSIVLENEEATLINFHRARTFGLNTDINDGLIREDLTDLGNALKALAEIKGVNIPNIDAYFKHALELKFQVDRWVVTGYESLKKILE